jgi:hypothetical protein
MAMYTKHKFNGYIVHAYQNNTSTLIGFHIRFQEHMMPKYSSVWTNWTISFPPYIVANLSTSPPFKIYFEILYFHRIAIVLIRFDFFLYPRYKIYLCGSGWRDISEIERLLSDLMTLLIKLYWSGYIWKFLFRRIDRFQTNRWRSSGKPGFADS